jgi:hypothetical protein
MLSFNILRRCSIHGVCKTNVSNCTDASSNAYASPDAYADADANASRTGASAYYAPQTSAQ